MSQFAKNPPKYTTAYLVQQSNCRWLCEPTCFSSLAKTMKSLFTPSLSDLYGTFPISPSLSLPLQTLRLVALVSLISKTKRIAERSAIVTHTHTPSHTDRQSTLGKYMVNYVVFYRKNTLNTVYFS